MTSGNINHTVSLQIPGISAGGGGGGATSAVPPTMGPALNEMAQHLRSISNQSSQMGGTMSRAMNQAGIKFNLAGILKQSQLFTGLVGSLFQIVGAMVDVLLAAFMPILVPGIRKLATLIPWLREKVVPIIRGSLDKLSEIYTGIKNMLKEEKEGASSFLQNPLGFLGIPGGLPKGWADGIAGAITDPFKVALGLIFGPKLLKPLLNVVKGSAGAVAGGVRMGGGMLSGGKTLPGIWGKIIMGATLLLGTAGAVQGLRKASSEAGEGNYGTAAGDVGEAGANAFAALTMNPLLLFVGEALTMMENYFKGDPIHMNTLLDMIGGSIEASTTEVYIENDISGYYEINEADNEFRYGMPLVE